MVRFTRYAAATAASLMMAAAVHAQDQSSSSAQQAGASQLGKDSPAMKLDQNFLKQTAIDNQFEIQLSQLAQTKAQDEKVKQLAQMMVQDHTAATEQLKQVAQKKQVQLPTDLPETKKEEIQIFQSLQGSEFDQAYLSCMKVSHAKGVAAYSEKSKNAKDQDVKQFASALLPKLQQHKQHVTAMTGGKDDDAQTAGSRSGSPAAGSSSSDRDASSPSGSGSGSSSGSGASGGSGAGTSSSGSGSRETGSGTSTGSGTTGAGSTGSSK